MAKTTRRPARRTPSRYHHGDLPRALLQEAVRTIQRRGAEALTLRGVGAALGVSRTALYRHFADKRALLAAVAVEGFRMLRRELFEAWDRHGRGRAGADAMGHAYIRFAMRHPSHYRVMFGGFVDPATRAATPWPEDTDAFKVLVDSIVERQQLGIVRRDDPLQLALYSWSVVHGIAMLALDGLLAGADVEALAAFSIARIATGIGMA
jgi:AcrR family transcriptional regulator